MAVDKAKVVLWDGGKAECNRLFRVALGTWHTLLPKLLGWSLSPGHLLFGAIRLIGLLCLALWPIWLKVYEAASSSPTGLSTPTWTQAVYLSVILTCIVAYNHVYDRATSAFKARSTRKKLLRQLADEIRGTIGKLSPLIKLARPVEDQDQLKVIRHKVLEWIRRVAQVHVGDFEGACIEVTLLTFEDPDCTKMRIEDRTTHARPVGKVIAAEEAMAYYAAKGRKHKCVNDFLKDPHPFPKSGISGPDPPYRSILLIPLLDTEGGSPDNCVGVVSIDSTRPYHFWPGAGGALVQKASPFCAWLTLLLKLDKANRLSCAS